MQSNDKYGQVLYIGHFGEKSNRKLLFIRMVVRSFKGKLDALVVGVQMILEL